MFVQSVGPLAHPADVDMEGVVHLRGGADGEGMPLKARYLRDLQEDPVARTEVEPSRPLDDEVGDATREDHSGRHDCLSPAHEAVQHSVGKLYQVDNQYSHKVFIELWSVQDEQSPVDPVEKMSAVEHLEVSASADPA